MNSIAEIVFYKAKTIDELFATMVKKKTPSVSRRGL